MHHFSLAHLTIFQFLTVGLYLSKDCRDFYKESLLDSSRVQGKCAYLDQSFSKRRKTMILLKVNVANNFLFLFITLNDHYYGNDRSCMDSEVWYEKLMDYRGIVKPS